MSRDWLPTRQLHAEDHAARPVGTALQRAAVLGDDVAGDGETKAGAAGFSGEEGIKDVALICFRDARSVIADVEAQAIR